MNNKKRLMTFAFALIFMLACSFAMWYVGRSYGVQYAVDHGVYFIVDYEPLEEGDYDLTLYIEIDNQVFDRGMYIC